jgi:hypothetical protein
MIKLDLDPKARVLGQFAWLAAIAMPVLAAFLTRGDARWYEVAAWPWTSPLVLALAGAGVLQLAAFLAGVPHLTRWLYVVLLVVTWPIGFVLSHVLIAAIYYLVITPIALVFRLMGRDVLGRRVDRTLPTYWRDRGAVPKPDSYFKLY